MLNSEADGDIARRQDKSVSSRAKVHRNRNLTFGTGPGKQTFHLLIVIAVETKPRTQTGWHMLGKKAIALYPIHTETLQLTIVADETQTIAIGKAGRPCHIERIAPEFLDCPHKLTHRLWRIEAGYIRLSPVREVSGVATIECPLQIGFKSIGATAFRSTAVTVGIPTNDVIETLTVSCRHIFHVPDILQSAFYLE